jgi:hypothetical protein
MLLDDIIVLLNETARKAHVVDDEPIDPRLWQDWLMLKRNNYIKNYINQKGTLEQNTLQFELLDVETYDTTLELSGTDLLSLGKYILRTELCPTLLEGKAGVAVYELTSADLLSRTIQPVSMDRLRWCGNGKVNKHFLFSAFYDGRFYIKSNSEIEKPLTKLRVVGVFADPMEVSTFVKATMDYPVNNYMIEYIKNDILNQDFNFIRQTKSDIINNANGEVQA